MGSSRLSADRSISGIVRRRSGTDWRRIVIESWPIGNSSARFIETENLEMPKTPFARTSAPAEEVDDAIGYQSVPWVIRLDRFGRERSST
jgi:hypothetical protein